MSDDPRHVLRRMDDLDAGRFRVPSHGYDRYRFHGCRCDVCSEAWRRVQVRAAQIDADDRDDQLNAEAGTVSRLGNYPTDAARVRDGWEHVDHHDTDPRGGIPR